MPTGLPSAGSTIAQLALSHDARRIAWTTQDSSTHIWATSADPVGAAPLTQGLGARFSMPAVASDGRIAFMGGRQGTYISTFLVSPGSPMRQVTTDAPAHTGPRWMRGDKELAVITAHGDAPGFWAVDPETGRERPLFLLSDIPQPPGTSQPSTASPAANIAITSDFSRLVMAVIKEGVPNLWMTSLKSFKPEGGLVQRTFEREGGSYPAWSPDGRWIAYQCTTGTSTNVCVVNVESGERTQLTNDAGQSWIGGWASDNDTVLFASRRQGVWNVATVSRTAKTVRTLTHFTEPRGYVRYPRWDPLNRRVVFDRADTTARLWAVELPR
jgi:Tol biopolymer transport system component